MRFFCIFGFTFGLFITQYCHLSLHWTLFFIWFVCCVCCFYSVRLIYLFFFLSGILWAGIYPKLIDYSVLLEGYEGKEILIQGFIADLPRENKINQGFNFKVEQAFLNQKEIKLPSKIKLSWYQKKQKVKGGERWQFLVRLKKPRSFKNPAGFDYAAWLAHKGIGAVGYVRKSIDNQLLGQKKMAFILNYRQKTKDHILHILGKTPQSAILIALTVGDKHLINDTQWQQFGQLGINHLIAISGLHIGMIATLSGLLFFRLWRAISILCYILPAQKASAIFALGIALLYALFSGFEVPSRRAITMLSLLLGAILFNRPIHSLPILLMAFFIIVVMEPMAIFSAGFWLSFSAVFSIVYILNGRIKPFNGWQTLIKMQFAISILLIPFTLGWFGRISIIAPLINPIAIIYTTWLVIPCAFIGLWMSFFFNNPIFLQWASKLIYFGLNTMDYVSQWQWISFEYANLPVWILACIGIAGLCLLLPRGLAGRGLALPFCLPAIFYSPKPIPQNEFQLTMLDVGQGLSMVIETHQHTLIYDLGPRFSTHFNAATKMVLPYLKKRHINQIDLLILSNADSDHAGAYQAFDQNISITKVISGEPKEIHLNAVESCHQEKKWQWDGIHFTILTIDHPEWLKNNDASCILLMSGAHFKVLLTGDISKKIEQALVQKYPILENTHVVQVAHHGSKTSSSALFIKTVKAQYALFSTGYRNKYHFPKEVVVKRWQQKNAVILNTSLDGALQFSTRQKQLFFKKYRENNEKKMD